MIIGIGTDIVRIDRIKRLVERDEGKAKALFLTPKEKMLKKSTSSIAGVFSVKEALLKVLGIGFSKGIGRLLEIEVENDEYGAPYIVVSGMVKQLFTEKGINSVKVTVSHEIEYAIAFVVCEG
jgi:holo-[acyl-carrier-protein] synthase